MFEARRSHIESRSEFERNLNLLIEGLIQKKVNFTSDLQDFQNIKNSIMSARELPNGRIDFTTIDERVRSLANSIAQLELID